MYVCTGELLTINCSKIFNMNNYNLLTVLFVIGLSLFILPVTYGQKDYAPSDITKVVILGTGNPNPDPDHSGP